MALFVMFGLPDDVKDDFVGCRLNGLVSHVDDGESPLCVYLARKPQFGVNGFLVEVIHHPGHGQAPLASAANGDQLLWMDNQANDAPRVDFEQLRRRIDARNQREPGKKVDMSLLVGTANTRPAKRCRSAVQWDLR